MSEISNYRILEYCEGKGYLLDLGQDGKGRWVGEGEDQEIDIAIQRYKNMKKARTFKIFRAFDKNKTSAYQLKPFLINRLFSEKEEPKAKRKGKSMKIDEETEINYVEKANKKHKFLDEDYTPEIQFSTDEDSIKDYGHFTLGDAAKKLIFQKVDNEDLLFKVIWAPRYDGTIPKPTLIPASKIKVHDPNTLFEYYETRIKFVQVRRARPNCEVIDQLTWSYQFHFYLIIWRKLNFQSKQKLLLISMNQLYSQFNKTLFQKKLQKIFVSLTKLILNILDQ